MSCAPLCVVRLSMASSSLSSAEPRSRIRACRRCSTRWSRICRRRSIFPRRSLSRSRTTKRRRLSSRMTLSLRRWLHKVVADPFVGRLTYFRVYSGTLSAGSYAYNATKGQKERIGRLLADAREPPRRHRARLRGRYLRRRRSEEHLHRAIHSATQDNPHSAGEYRLPDAGDRDRH